MALFNVGDFYGTSQQVVGGSNVQPTASEASGDIDGTTDVSNKPGLSVAVLVVMLVGLRLLWELT